MLWPIGEPESTMTARMAPSVLDLRADLLSSWTQTCKRDDRISNVQPPKRISVSFIVDSDPVFAYTGWHLVHSLLEHTPLTPADIHVQCLPEVDGGIMERFAALGCNTHRLARFGDGRFCNKLAQWRICEIAVTIMSRILDKCLFLSV